MLIDVRSELGACPELAHACRCPDCQMLLWPSPLPVRMKFHELRHSTNTLLAALNVPENVRADILGHRTRAMTRRYTHLSVEQMRQGLKKLDAAALIRVAPGVPAATQEANAMQADAGSCTRPTDAGLTPSTPAKTKPRTPPKP